MYTTFPDSKLPDINKDVAFEINTSLANQPSLGGVILMFPDSMDDGVLKKSLTCNVDADFKCKEGVSEYTDDGDKFILTLKEHLFTNRILYMCLLVIIFICLYYIFFHTTTGKKRKHHSRK